MKKLVKISLIIAIISTLFINFSVFAVETRTNETNIEASNSSKDSENTVVNSSKDTDLEDNESKNESKSTNKSSSTQVSSVSSVNEGELTISDILNILLIATSVVIILLAIAILLKIK